MFRFRGVVRSSAKLCTINQHVAVRLMSNYTPVTSLLTAAEALSLFDTPNVKFVDASFHMNKDVRHAYPEYISKRIPGSNFIDIDSSEFSNKAIDLPHMMPSAELFAESITNLGISNDDHVIVYTGAGSFGAPRVWWMFRAFGHGKVSILNGGLEAWVAAGGPVESGPARASSPAEKPFRAELNPKYIASCEDVLKVVGDGSAQIVDARSSARFNCLAPEPRPGLPMGHIPGSLNVPFTSIVQLDDFTKFRSREHILEVFDDAGVIKGCRVIGSCGSGVTAAVLIFALHLIGHKLDHTQIYDGKFNSWNSSIDIDVSLLCLQVHGQNGAVEATYPKSKT